MGNVLIVGGTGPTGPGVVRGLLDRGHNVSVLHRGVHEVPLPEEVPHIHCDPHDIGSVRGSVQVHEFDLAILMYGRTRHFIPLLAGQVEKVVAVSGTAYEAGFNSLPISETASQDSKDPLFAKLVETEAAFTAAHEQGLFSVVQMRYPHLYGPRQLAPREWSVVRRIRDGRRSIPVIEGGLAIQSRAYVDNAVAGLLTVVDNFSAAAGRIYHVADEESLSDRDTAMCIANAAGVDIELVSFPGNSPGPAAFWLVGRDLRFAMENSRPHIDHSLLSNRRISDLGYMPVVSAREGLLRTVAWYLENPPLRGGEEETQLGDPFDYAAEDRAFAEAQRYAAKLAGDRPNFSYRHPYPHPKLGERQSS